MKSILILIGCLILSMGYAETIQNVEYHLPQAAQNWTIGHQLENKSGTTIIYIPPGTEGQDPKEMFGVNANFLAFDTNNLDMIKKGLSIIYPHFDIEFNLLEKNNNGIIYEWLAKANGIEKLHGWGRIFADEKGSVVLGYQTENISDVEKARLIWLPVLKNAQIP